jgi:hypothetical protein
MIEAIKQLEALHKEISNDLDSRNHKGSIEEDLQLAKHMEIIKKAIMVLRLYS